MNKDLIKNAVKIISVLEDLGYFEAALLEELLECAYIYEGCLSVGYGWGDGNLIANKLAEKLNVSPRKIKVNTMVKILVNKGILEKHQYSLHFARYWGQEDWRNLKNINFNIY